MAAATPGPARAATSSALGLYSGGGNADAFNSFASWLGTRPHYALDFLSDQSWSTIDDPSWFVSRWSGTGARLVLTVPMLPASGATLNQEATGAYNSYFRTLAQRLVAGGDANGIVRLGWEFNGNWYPWSIKDNNAANFAQAWRQIVTTMRSVSGQKFAFDWCISDGSSYVNGVPLNPQPAYPGDAYVDSIGMDVYDQSWVSNPASEANRWNGYVNQPYGMAWQRAFAAAHGKPISFPEWGLDRGGTGYGGGDSPQFVQDMYSWMKSSNLAFQAYFNFRTPEGDHVLSHYPNAAARFRALFGSVGSASGVSANAARAHAHLSSSRRRPRRRASHLKRRPLLRITPLRVVGATLIKLTWRASGDAVDVFGNGRRLSHDRKRNSLLLRPRRYTRQMSLLVCDVRTRLCSRAGHVRLPRL